MEKNPFRYDLVYKGEVVINERVLLRPDGSEVDVEMHTRMMPDGTIQSIYHDITDRKRAEEEINESNELFSLFMRHSPIYCFIKDVNPARSLVLQASDNYSDMIGIPGSEMKGKTMYELFPPDFAEKITADDWSVVSRGEVLKLDEELNGRYYNTIKFPIMMGNKTLLAGYTIDITDRKQVETALLKSERKLDIMLQTVVDGMMTVDCSGKINYCNKGAEQILGVGKNILGKYHQGGDWIYFDEKGEPYPGDQLPLSIVLRDRSTVTGIELKIVKQNGEMKYLSMNAAPLIDETGKLLGGIASFRDVTGSKLAEENIRKLLSEKELILKEVHHRIKNNMNTISSLLTLQADTLKDPVAVTALEDAGRRVHSMMMLYDRLYQSADFKDIGVMNYLSSLADEIVSNFPNSGNVKIIKQIDDFTLDVKRLSNIGIIVNEILTNTMKYAFPGGRNGNITISASLKGRHTVISFHDDGIGIPENINFGNSKGFGLDLVSILTEQIGGSIRIVRGSGTGFILEFDI